MNRHNFITSSAMAAAMAGMRADGSQKEQNMNNLPSKNPSDRLGGLLPTRPLGSTGEMVTIFGAGGSHIGQAPEKDAQAMIEAALEGGCRFFDTAEAYQKGGSERYYGKFLTPKYRQDVYIMTKTEAKDAKTAKEHLDGSLARMKTDYIDLWQIHAIKSEKDVDERLENGVLEAFLEAREKGKVRHIGFTGHRTWKAHNHMLEKTDLLQTCQMPVNIVDPYNESYIEHILPLLVKRRMGVIAMKTAAYGMLMKRGAVPAKVSLEEMHFFVWSLPVSVLVGGFDNVDQLRQRMQFARTFTGLTAQDREDIVARAKDFAGLETEIYKRW
jgi:uncharacterized protein